MLLLAMPWTLGFVLVDDLFRIAVVPLHGIVVGSAIVKMIAENSNRDDLVAVVSHYAREMKKAIAGS